MSVSEQVGDLRLSPYPFTSFTDFPKGKTLGREQVGAPSPSPRLRGEGSGVRGNDSIRVQNEPEFSTWFPVPLEGGTVGEGQGSVILVLKAIGRSFDSPSRRFPLGQGGNRCSARVSGQSLRLPSPRLRGERPGVRGIPVPCKVRNIVYSCFWHPGVQSQGPSGAEWQSDND